MKKKDIGIQRRQAIIKEIDVFGECPICKHMIRESKIVKHLMDEVGLTKALSKYIEPIAKWYNLYNESKNHVKRGRPPINKLRKGEVLRKCRKASAAK